MLHDAHSCGLAQLDRDQLVKNALELWIALQLYMDPGSATSPGSISHPFNSLRTSSLHIQLRLSAALVPQLMGGNGWKIPCR